MTRVLRRAAALVLALQALDGMFLVWSSTVGGGRVVCGWEAVADGGGCPTSTIRYGLFAGAVLLGLALLIAAVLLAEPRLARPLPRGAAAALLALALAVQLCRLGSWLSPARWDYGSSGWGDLAEELVSLVAAAFVAVVCAGVVRQALRRWRRPAG